MTPTVRFWIVILALAVGTFLQRSIPLWMHGRVPLPEWLQRLLRHVPVAALTALVVPGSLYLKTAGVYAFSPARTIAGLAALLVALKAKNVAVTLVAGMVVLWAAQAVLG